MMEVKIKSIKLDHFNPFHANEEELIAQALNDAGLITESTTLNEKTADELLSSFYDKRSLYRNATRLGSLLIESGKIPLDKLKEALEFQKKNKEMKIGAIIAQFDLCSAEEIESFLEIQKKRRTNQKGEVKKQLNSKVKM